MSGFVHELCIAITGRWEPDRLFMMFVGYIDESDTHGPAPNMTMVAYLATAKNWRLFERGFRVLKREFGFSVLHGTNFRAQTGDFENWPYAKHQALTERLGRLSEDHLTESFSVVCEHDVYKGHFRDVLPRKMHATSQYGVCFEALTLAMIIKLLERPRDNPRLSIVVEDGHKNASDTARIFEELKKQYRQTRYDILRTHTLASKEDGDPLMAVDMGAYGSARRERAIKAGTYVPIAKDAKAPSKADVGHTNMRITPNYLAMKIEHFNKRRAADHEEYLKRGELWRALQASEEQPS